MNKFLYFFLFAPLMFWAQEAEESGFERKKIKSVRTSMPIEIDGEFDEEVWKEASLAKDFYNFEPQNGTPEPDSLKTEVKILYDDHAIYVAATLFDNQPDKILKEITERDDFGTADFFGVFINGYNDGQQQYSFFVSAANGQADCVRTQANGEDFSWDAIWHSQVKITDKGWQIEMKIPYAALRFPKIEVQNWGINFFREVRRLRYKYSWNKVDNQKGTFTQQEGILEELRNIETPTRLFLIPYASYYASSEPYTATEHTFKGGMDIKYGINDAFTLDAVLIPDFGQTKFDNKILNLGPFEQVFNENRPFFTEGTDLFNKGNLFYSRRIGGAPSTFPNLSPDEIIEEFPSSVPLINATKVSGRTKSGLGIGVLNAVTKKTDVSILNTATNSSRTETVEPLTNYNVLVFDQRFNQNSSISFINTNVTRAGEFRDANVSALVYDLSNKKNTYNLMGTVKYSFVNHFGTQENKKGFVKEIDFSETAGKYRFSIGGDYMSKDFDNNDLGVNFQTNYFTIRGNASYRILKATEKLNSFRVFLNAFGQFNNDSKYLQQQNFNVNINAVNKKNHAGGIGFNFRPFEVYDYYDSRVEGRYTIYPKTMNTWMFVSTNYNNKFAFDINPWVGTTFNMNNWWFYGVDFSPRYRFSDKFSLIYRNSFNDEKNNHGWIAIDNTGEIIYARREVMSFETGLEGKYSINSKMNFKLNLRHYWSFAENHETFRLLENGRLEKYEYTGNRNQNLNLWNVDLSYSWWFAPGSQMTVLYRNNADSFTNQVNKSLSSNYNSVLNYGALNHTFSINLRYFIDYNEAKHLASTIFNKS